MVAKSQIDAIAKIQNFRYWIPACAGMTSKGPA
jgi:hypothetical protein